MSKYLSMSVLPHAISASFLTLLAVAALSGCAGSQVAKLPEELSPSGKKVVVKLDSRGHILAAVKLKKGMRCEVNPKGLKLEIKGVEKGNKFSVVQSCSFLPGMLVAHSSVPLTKGEYEVHASIDKKGKGLEGDAKLSVRYGDADFSSGADQDFGGAAELAENQTVKGTVNYLIGDATDWVKAKGGSAVMLTLLEDSDGTTAKVYKLAKGSANPYAVGELRNKQRRRFKVDKGDELLVKVSGDKFDGEGNYTLIRRDLSGGDAGGKKVNLAVIDCYPVTNSSSLVLLRAAENMKVDDEVEITGMRASGAPLKLGKCRVGSVADGQASCRLDRVLPSDLVEYRAEAVLGGET